MNQQERIDLLEKLVKHHDEKIKLLKDQLDKTLSRIQQNELGINNLGSFVKTEYQKRQKGSL